MENVARKDFLSQTFKAALIALLVTVAAVLLLALLTKFFTIPTDILPVINQVLKIGAVALGVCLSVRQEKFLAKGALSGLIYAFLSFALFMALGGMFDIWHLLLDAGVSVVVGAICALLVSKKR